MADEAASRLWRIELGFRGTQEEHDAILDAMHVGADAVLGDAYPGMTIISISAPVDDLKRGERRDWRELIEGS